MLTLVEQRYPTVTAQRLAELMEARGLDQPALANAVGCSQGAISQILTGRTTNSRFLPKIATALSVSLPYLIGLSTDPGAEGSFTPTPDLIAEQLDAVLLPEVQVSYSMGGGAYNDDWPVVQMVPFSRAWLRGLTTSPASELMVARGDGDSMMPTILDQDLVIIDRAQKSILQQDRIWALSYGQRGMIKRVRALPDGSYEVNSDNHSVTPIRAYDGEMSVVGRVVGIVRKI